MTDRLRRHGLAVELQLQDPVALCIIEEIDLRNSGETDLMSLRSLFIEA
jgi:hypothetical protein